MQRRPPGGALLVMRVSYGVTVSCGHHLGAARRPVRRQSQRPSSGTLLFEADVVRDRTGTAAVGGTVVWTWY